MAIIIRSFVLGIGSILLFTTNLEKASASCINKIQVGNQVACLGKSKPRISPKDTSKARIKSVGIRSQYSSEQTDERVERCVTEQERLHASLNRDTSLRKKEFEYKANAIESNLRKCRKIKQ